MVNGTLTLGRYDLAMRNDRLAVMIKECAESYSKLSRPMPADRVRIVRMVRDNFAMVGFADQRALAGVFAALRAPPVKLVAYFCHEAQDEIAAPFISHSPAIDRAVGLAIIDRHGPGARTRAIARRADLCDHVIAALRALDDEAIDRALELRQRALASPVADIPVSARDPLPPSALSSIADLAAHGDKGLLATALADATGLSMQSATALCDDPSSRNILFALRFCGFDTELGLTVFSALAGEVAGSDTVRARFRTCYESIGTDEAAERVRAWKLDELRTIERLRQQIANDPHTASTKRQRA